MISEAPRTKLRGIRDKTERISAEARHPPSPRLRRGHLALPPHSKLWGIRAKASEILEELTRQSSKLYDTHEIKSILRGQARSEFARINE